MESGLNSPLGQVGIVLATVPTGGPWGFGAPLVLVRLEPRFGGQVLLASQACEAHARDRVRLEASREAAMLGGRWFAPVDHTVVQVLSATAR